MILPMEDTTVCDLSLVPSTGTRHSLCVLVGGHVVRVLSALEHQS